MKRDIDFSDNDSPEEHEYKKRAQKSDNKRMLQKLEAEKQANNEAEEKNDNKLVLVSFLIAIGAIFGLPLLIYGIVAVITLI